MRKRASWTARSATPQNSSSHSKPVTLKSIRFVILLADAAKYLAGRQQLASLQSRLQQIGLVEEVIRKNTEELEGLSAPDEVTLSKLDRLATTRVQLQTQLDGALLHVQLTPEAARRIEVLQGSPSGSRQAAAGEDVRVSGSPAVELVLEGFGRMKVTGPSSSASEIKPKLAQVTSQLQEITARFGSDDLALLKIHRQRAVVLETEIAGARKSRQQILEGQTAEGLREETEPTRTRSPGRWRTARRLEGQPARCRRDPATTRGRKLSLRATPYGVDGGMEEAPRETCRFARRPQCK